MTEKVLIIDLNSNPEYQRLLGGTPQTCGMRSGKVYLSAGKECGLHSTKAQEELLVFISGNGVLVIAEKERLEVGAGKVAYIPPQTDHNVMNTGNQPLVYVYCVTPVNETV